MKRALLIAFALLFAFSCCACKDESETKNSSSKSVSKVKKSENKNAKKSSKKSKTKNLTLYFCYSDSLDPYSAQSSGNQSLCPLLFDSLTKLDNDLNPKNLIASEIENEGTTVRISLNSYKFSDGTTVSASDVIYSIEKCKGAKYGAYVHQLDNVKSYTSSGDEVVLTLDHADKNFARVLDFPILKSGTTKKTNSDGKAIPPVGSGRYVLSDNKGKFSLKANEYYFGKKPKYKINLKNIPDYGSLEYLIRSNSINVYYSGFATKEMPTLKTKTKTVNLTNLVYLGINQKNTFLGEKNIRKAISYAISRADISENCYYSLSKAALSIYNESNKIIEKHNDIFNRSSESEKSKDALEKSGYKTLGSQGYYKNSSGDHITLSLLYNKDNNLQSMSATSLIKQMKSAGIEVKADARDEKSYKNAVKKGDYEIYLAEIRLNKSFDYTSLLNTKVKLKDKNKFLSVYKKYLQGSVEIEEVLTSFKDELPFVPLVFKLGTLSIYGNFSKEIISSISDPYYNIESIHLK